LYSDSKSNIYIYGSDNLKKYIKNLNINLTSLENSELVLIGRKEENNNTEINEIIKNVSLGKNILCLNKDLTFPTEYGEKPGNGVVVKIIEDALSINIPTLGKSGNHYSSYFIQNKIIIDFVIGDRVDTDIIFGKNLNAKTFLVSSGIKNFLDVNFADIQLNKFSDVVPFLTKHS
jgi:ribonucleotide monophosphatase NagD (HAD superfamily)